MSAYTDADYLRWDPFDGANRDVDIRARTVKIVTTRSPHRCVGQDGAAQSHDMQKGTRARVERAIVDGEWGSYYMCIGCMAEWLVARGLHGSDG